MARIVKNAFSCLALLVFLAYLVIRLFFTEEAEAEFRHIAGAHPAAYSGLMVLFGGILIRALYAMPEHERNGFDLLIAWSILIVGAITLCEVTL